MDIQKESLVQHDENQTVSDSVYAHQEVSVVVNDDGIPDVTVVNKTKSQTQETKVYKRRWYVLLVFSFVAMMQGGLWNTWGPIAASSEEAFDWTDGDIALYANWGPIAYLVATFPFAWLIDTKGLRSATLIAAIMVATGAGVRCITDNPDHIKWTVNIGQLLNGLAGPVAMGVPPALSARWFPVNERTTATAISSILNSLGVGISFIIGPYFVPDKQDTGNATAYNSSTILFTCGITEHYRSGPPLRHNIMSIKHHRSFFNVSITNGSRIVHERQEIMKLMYWECGMSVLALLLVIVYFPDKPKLPPTVSASVERVDFKEGIKQLMRNVKFWMICLTYGVSLGVYNCWQSVLDVILKPHGISEDEAGWLGFYSLVAGCIITLAVAKFADVFAKHMRLFLLVLYIGGCGSLVWFTFLLLGTIHSSTVQLYMSIILLSMFLGSTSPLYFEMACEATYPVAEGVTNLVLTLVNNIGGLIFLVVQMVPHIGTEWENWCLLGAIAACIPVLVFLKENYNRLEIDETEINVDSN
ncbi:MFS transporter, FLVCR family, disrupted in renal carcinoma protein 2 [Mytilus galloprovincialis]|uniref:MFS transporter, FLVCR family, disrupted in renal carcinoma protein 2 n=1 Tax=Mytilus galloprovincialis TaxID=29158 RepID=A0A8B6CZH7_MYTGA|nr:MFS transporter, FLVCR family, disrupted in renal carcinoma protein 2 [Mytilus galloprovincialis]